MTKVAQWAGRIVAGLIVAAVGAAVLFAAVIVLGWLAGIAVDVWAGVGA